MAKSRTAPFLWSAAIALIVTLTSIAASAATAELTRFLASYERMVGPPQETMTKFVASAGPATVIVTDLEPFFASTQASGSVRLNGSFVLGPRNFLARRQDVYEIPVMLKNGENTLNITVRGMPGSRFNVRIKQEVSTDVALLSRVHFNPNVSNFQASRAFFADLGFAVGIDFPQTNTLAVAESIGVQTPTEFRAEDWEERLASDVAAGIPIGDEGGYLLKGQLIALPNFAGSFIDLIEFTIPRNDDPPYPNIYHLGMAMATLETADIEADYDYMVGKDIEFLAPPTQNDDDEWFAIFKDPDGIFYQLLETESAPLPGINTNINRIGKVTINVTDLERSVAYYQLLGFEEVRDLFEAGSAEAAEALGVPEGFSRVGKLMSLPDGSQVELVQWIDPSESGPPYPLPINHIGINRIAFAVPNITDAVEELTALGIEFLSPIAPCCAGDASTQGIVGFYDPDGTILELFGDL